MREPPSARLLILTYVGLVALAALSWLATDFVSSSVLSIGIAVAKALLIALVFMELMRAHATDRIIAIIAVGFVVLLCVGAVADVGLR